MADGAPKVHGSKEPSPPPSNSPRLRSREDRLPSRPAALTLLVS